MAHSDLLPSSCDGILSEEGHFTSISRHGGRRRGPHSALRPTRQPRPQLFWQAVERNACEEGRGGGGRRRKGEEEMGTAVKEEERRKRAETR